MTKRLATLAVAALLYIPVPAQGQNITSRPLQTTENLTFTGATGPRALWDNVRVGPYAAVLESDPTRPSLTLYCVDFANSISVGANWDVNTTNIGPDNADLSSTRLSSVAASDQPGALVRYRKAAYLASLFDSWTTFTGATYTDPVDGTTQVSYANKRGVFSGIHAAIWSIMTGGFPENFNNINNKNLATAMAQTFVDMADLAAATNFSGTGINFAEWSVLSDVNGGSLNPTGGKQEYLVRTVTPEPSTYVLLASGLLMLFAISRRRRPVEELA